MESKLIKDVKIRNEYIIICKFKNGTIKIYDLKPLFKKIKIFNKLKENEELFQKVKVNEGGYGISWNDEIDLSAEEIWENGYDEYITPDIIEVNAKENYVLDITFETEEERIFDMKELIKNNKIYENLEDKEYFRKVEPRGETIQWPNGEDVCPEKLYYDSIEK